MSALTDRTGGALTLLVEMQRGMTDDEVRRFLLLGEVPDFSKNPEDNGDEEQVMPLNQARDMLASWSLTAAGDTSSSLSHSEDNHSETFTFDPTQKRDEIGRWTKDGGNEVMDWERAIDMTQAEWNALSDSERAGLLGAVFVAEGDGKPQAAGTLAKLRGWIGSGKGGGGGGGGGGTKKSDEKTKKKPKKDDKSATKKRPAADPDVTLQEHDDGYIAGESTTGNRRMRWDKPTKNYVIESLDKKTNRWAESRRMTPDQARAELRTAGWLKPQRANKDDNDTAPKEKERVK